MAARKSAAARRRAPAPALDPRAEEARRDEVLLLSTAWAAFREGVATAEGEAAFAAQSIGGQPLRPEPAAPSGRVERLVVHNWKPEPGLVSIGDVQLELEPGQQVTLWVKAGVAPPVQDSAEQVDGSLSILTDDDRLVG